MSADPAKDETQDAVAASATEEVAADAVEATEVAEAAEPLDNDEESEDAVVEDAKVIAEDESPADAPVAVPEDESTEAADAGDAVDAVAVVAAEAGSDDNEDDDEDDPPILPYTPKTKKPKKASSSTGKASKASKRKRRPGRHSTGDNALGISNDRLDSATAAREMLLTTTPKLPISISDMYTVRSFGQLCMDDAGGKYATPTALYPVGFCCDRYEFSPVHGRVIKMRCGILDGKKTNLDYDGPVFRIMWGQGVDEDVDKVEYPYNPYSNSAPISNSGDDVVALPTNQSSKADKGLNALTMPVVGMRVKVRFEMDQFYYGTIIEVEDDDGDVKKRSSVDVTIQYDDGSTEEAVFPDPDISLVMPGNGEELSTDGNIELSELNGKPVQTTIGRTPLEAWSNCLIKLGLVDEIMIDLAMEAMKTSREQVVDKKSKPEVKKRQKPRDMSEDNADGDAKDEAPKEEGTTEPEAPKEEEPEPASEEEKKLLERVAALREEMADLKKEDNLAAKDLADMRIAALGQLLCNPFVEEEEKSHQASWMAAVIKKEKSKMGSTGNKRKIVTAIDLLERNNSIYNPEVEILLEGLPGSEYCSSYLYQTTRGNSTASRQWLQEQKMKQEREMKRRLKHSKEAKVKASAEREKQLKRKKREDERDARKRQKLEEEEEKKKARVEERLERLRVQVDERLYKEASFQREKVVLLLAKNLAKEFARRRKAAEVVSAQVIATSKPAKITNVHLPDLPPLSKRYDEDIVRIWDFISTFGKFFVDRGYMEEIPALDSLQTAIETLRGAKTNMNKAEATSFFTELAVSLCKPLSAGLTRMLFASLIALNPTLQKDFGAAFFNEVNATKTKEEEETSTKPNVLLPVSNMTWKEIARIAFLSDALGELGYARQEAAHLLRGYRSAGHPNSKEARRLRRVEDFSVALLRQTLRDPSTEVSHADNSSNVIRIDVPSSPSCTKNDWIFYLHSIISMPDATQLEIVRANLKKAVEIATTEKHQAAQLLQEFLADLPDKQEAFSGVSLKKKLMSLMEKETGEIFSKISYGEAVRRNELEFSGKAELEAFDKQQQSELYRARMGELSTLDLSAKELKELIRVREEYMSDALQLKEEMKRQEMKEAGEADDDDEDEDDEDEDQEEGATEGAKKETVTAEVVEDSTTPQNEPVATNGESSEQMKVDDPVTSKGPTSSNEQKIGKETQHDDFCGDIPSAPELIRRCLAVLRTLAQSGPAEPFIYPVDPQTNPGYYDMLLQPMCLREVGLRLQKAAKAVSEVPEPAQEVFVAKTVTEFGRNVRLIGRNCLSYANTGPTIISAGGEMLRIFERLLLDWVLAPKDYLTSLDKLDDDLCVDPHPSDLESTVLLCDGCEGNFNIARLEPPLLEIPKGDWYCPRCVSGRWWGDLDPRLGQRVTLSSVGSGVVKDCTFCHLESMDKKSSLMYTVETEDGSIVKATVDEIDQALKDLGTPVAPITCEEAVAESKGYGSGIDRGLRHDMVPVLLNPKVSDAASQVALSSSVFRDSVAIASNLLINDPREMKASEWLKLLVLLIMKCSSSDVMQNIASEMENEAADRLAKRLESISKIESLSEALQDEEPNEVGEAVKSTASIAKPAVKVEAEATTTTVEAKPTIVGDDEEDDSAMVVEASAVEVVESMELEVIPSSSDVAEVEVLEHDDPDASRTTAINEKARRQKDREDSIAAFFIKNQLRSTVASFEQDYFSHVVESTLATEEQGLSFSASRCRGAVCDFCGLSDTALGSNLVRVPNTDEWDELIKHALNSKRTSMIAEISDERGSISVPRAREGKKLIKLSVRVDDELIADDIDEAEFNQITDGGMLEFVPRNMEGYQDELFFRYESNLPIVSGSLSAHECCAVAAHNARKLKVVQDFKEKKANLADLEEGNTCGRTLEIGRDRRGRSYWAFNSDKDSLFVCTAGRGHKSTLASWDRYAEPESISSVIVSLGKDPIVADLKRAFPKSRGLLKNGKWADKLMKRHFRLGANEPDSVVKDEMQVDDHDEDDDYVEKEKVLVESKDGRHLWDAQIKAVARNEDGKVTGYRVHYAKWSTRFDEWVSADRVVEANENNKDVQATMIKDAAVSRSGLPLALEHMVANDFLNARDRARGNAGLPNFSQVASVGPGATENETIFASMKAALLAIEAALPLGSVNHTDRGDWRPEFASRWRIMVKEAKGSWELMRLVILLEDTISEDWIQEQIGHLRTCLPSRWKALDEACPSSIALRVFLLDRGLLYGTVDKKRYKQSKKR